MARLDHHKTVPAVVKLGPACVEPLIAVLQNAPDASRRMNAAQALGEIKDWRAVEPLVAALRDPAIPVRTSAARALGEMRDPRAVEPLIAALSDPSFNVRQEAAASLGLIGDQRAVGPLLKLAWDETGAVDAVGLSAIHALGLIGDPAALATLERWHQKVSDEYGSNWGPGFIHPMAAEAMYFYFTPLLEALTGAITMIRREPL
jgi:HEAT repeat protein